MFRTAPNGSDLVFGGLTASLAGNPTRSISIDSWKALNALDQAPNTNVNLAASSYAHAVSIGESNTENVTLLGGNWSSGVFFDIVNADSTNPISNNQWTSGSTGNVTCPAVSATRAGSLVVCEVYLDAGTANAGVVQAPAPSSGWTFDRASGGQYEEMFGFHATATTSAGQSIPAMQFNLKNGSGFLANWLAETVVIQPPLPSIASPTPAPWPAGAVETPGASDAFVESAGVNIHLSYYGTLYGDNFQRIESLLQGLGVRHVRDGIAPGVNNICSEYQQLASAGIHVDDITSPNMTSQSLAQWATCAGSALEALEPPNEYDLSGEPSWLSVLQTFQRAYPALKSLSSTLEVLGPAVTTESAYAALGDLSSIEDFGNMHDYFSGRNPGNLGSGSTDRFGTYGSLSWNIAVAKQASKSRSIIATETGYGDAVGTANAVPAATKGRYIMRTLLEHWIAGVSRTYFYELVSNGSDSFRSYGLTDSSGNPKPAYVALQNLLGHLTDRGPAFVTTPLKYTIGAAAPVHHLLLQKRNGAYALILWAEAPEWDPVAGAPVAPITRPVTLTFMKPPSALELTTFADDGSAQSAALTATGGQAVLTATNQVKIIDITP